MAGRHSATGAFREGNVVGGAEGVLRLFLVRERVLVRVVEQESTSDTYGHYADDTACAGRRSCATSRVSLAVRSNGRGDLELGLAATMDILTSVLSNQPETAGRLVLDKTGLTGNYDWTLKWTPERSESMV